MGEQMTVEKAMEYIRKSQNAFNELVNVDDKGHITIGVSTINDIRECLLKFQNILLDASVVIP